MTTATAASAATRCLRRDRRSPKSRTAPTSDSMAGIGLGRLASPVWLDGDRLRPRLVAGPLPARVLRGGASMGFHWDGLGGHDLSSGWANGHTTIREECDNGGTGGCAPEDERQRAPRFLLVIERSMAPRTSAGTELGRRLPPPDRTARARHRRRRAYSARNSSSIDSPTTISLYHPAARREIGWVPCAQLQPGSRRFRHLRARSGARATISALPTDRRSHRSTRPSQRPPTPLRLRPHRPGAAPPPVRRPSRCRGELPGPWPPSCGWRSR